MKKHFLIAFLFLLGLGFLASCNEGSIVETNDSEVTLRASSGPDIDIDSNCGDITVTVSGNCSSPMLGYEITDSSGTVVAQGSLIGVFGSFDVNDLPDCEDYTLELEIRGCGVHYVDFDTHTCNGGSVC